MKNQIQRTREEAVLTINLWVESGLSQSELYRHKSIKEIHFNIGGDSFTKDQESNFLISYLSLRRSRSSFPVSLFE